MSTVIQFRDQADAIEQLCMKVFGAKPEYLERVAPRYYRYFDVVWKSMPDGRMFTRDISKSNEWRESSLGAFDMVQHDMREVTAEEGEQLIAPAPANEFRYFQRGETVWKMPPHGLGYIRDATEKFWEGSICDLSEMLHNDGTAKYREISAEEGEP
jgi:hypothetical protein